MFGIQNQYLWLPQPYTASSIFYRFSLFVYIKFTFCFFIFYLVRKYCKNFTQPHTKVNYKLLGESCPKQKKDFIKKTKMKFMNLKTV